MALGVDSGSGIGTKPSLLNRVKNSACLSSISKWGRDNPKMVRALKYTAVAAVIFALMGTVLLAYMHFSGLGIAKTGFVKLGHQISANVGEFVGIVLGTGIAGAIVVVGTKKLYDKISERREQKKELTRCVESLSTEQKVDETEQQLIDIGFKKAAVFFRDILDKKGVQRDHYAVTFITDFHKQLLVVSYIDDLFTFYIDDKSNEFENKTKQLEKINPDFMKNFMDLT